MALLQPEYEDGLLRAYLVACPGCKNFHVVYVNTPARPRWEFNGNVASPTFSPSLLVQWPSMSKATRERFYKFKDEHGRYPTQEEIPNDFNNVCHSFIRNGMWEFLGDCTHDLKGQTVPMVDVETFDE